MYIVLSWCCLVVLVYLALRTKTVANKEWEVISFEYVPEDMNYRTLVIPYCQYKNKKTEKQTMEFEVRLPYKPRVGQIISCPKLL